jgi:hypothetical protein
MIPGSGRSRRRRREGSGKGTDTVALWRLGPGGVGGAWESRRIWRLSREAGGTLSTDGTRSGPGEFLKDGPCVDYDPVWMESMGRNGKAWPKLRI